MNGTFKYPRAPHPAPIFTLHHSAYGDVFMLSTEISGYTAYSPPLSGSDILNCFGFDEGRFEADLGLLAAIGGCGLVVAYGLLLYRRG